MMPKLALYSDWLLTICIDLLPLILIMSHSAICISYIRSNERGPQEVINDPQVKANPQNRKVDRGLQAACLVDLHAQRRHRCHKSR
jgi:hypothetical protein